MPSKYICKSCKRKRENQDDHSMEVVDKDQSGHFGNINCEESIEWAGSYCSNSADFEIRTDNPDSPPGY